MKQKGFKRGRLFRDPERSNKSLPRAFSPHRRLGVAGDEATVGGPLSSVGAEVVVVVNLLQSLDSPRCCEGVNTCGDTVPVKGGEG